MGFQATLKSPVACWRVWLLLAMQDIKMRYRRSSLGPFWISISMATIIYTMGFLYGYLLHANIHEYFPFLSIGIITWSLISSLINEGPNSFIESQNFIRNLPLPFSVYVMRVVARNFIIFLHNIIVFIPIAFIFSVHLNAQTLLLIPGLLFIALNGFSFGIALGILGTRFRDISQLVASLTQMVFYVTPIMWQPQLIPEKYAYFYKLNPAEQFVNLVRNPLLGQPITALNWAVVILVTVASILACHVILTHYRSRIAFWI